MHDGNADPISTMLAALEKEHESLQVFLSRAVIVPLSVEPWQCVAAPNVRHSPELPQLPHCGRAAGILTSYVLGMLQLFICAGSRRCKVHLCWQSPLQGSSALSSSALN